MKYGNVTGEIFADAFAVCRARMRKTAKKLPAPSRMYRGGRESRAGKPRQSPRRQSNPPKPAAVRGSPPKPAVRCSPPKTAAGRGNPPKRPLAANRAEYKKSGGSYDPPFAWFIFVSLLKTNISLALFI